MHEHHKGHSHSNHHHGPEDEDGEVLRKLQVILEHWTDHEESHIEGFREWAEKASAAGEDEIAREIHLAIGDSLSARDHLKRARAIAAAKLVLRK